MSRTCPFTQKKPLIGHAVSHANNKSKRRFLPNLQSRRFWSASTKRFIKLRVSAQTIKTIDKLGVDAVLTKIRSDRQSKPNKNLPSNRTKKTAKLH